MNPRKSACVITAAVILGIAGCETYDPYRTSGPTYPTYPPSQEIARYGYVDSIDTIAAERRSPAPGVGAIGGAIVGGVVGHQIGSGSGNTAATIGGAVIGGVVGHQVEQSARNRQGAGLDYLIRVRMDDGTYQTLRKETHDGMRVGDRVLVERGSVYPM